MNSSTKNFLIFIAVLSVLFVLGDIFLWVNIVNTYNEQQIEGAYLKKYPEGIRSTSWLSILPLILLAFASLVLIRASKKGFFKVVAATVAAILSLVIIWKMFMLI